MKILRIFKNSIAGIGILETTIAAGIAGVAILGMMQMIETQNKSTKVAMHRMDELDLLTMVRGRLIDNQNNCTAAFTNPPITLSSPNFSANLTQLRDSSANNIVSVNQDHGSVTVTSLVLRATNNPVTPLGPGQAVALDITTQRGAMAGNQTKVNTLNFTINFNPANNTTTGCSSSPAGNIIAWGRFDGQTCPGGACLIIAGFNVASVMRLGSGDFQVNMTNPATSGNAYVVMAYNNHNGNDDRSKADAVLSTTASNFRLRYMRKENNNHGGENYNPSDAHFIVVGN